MSNKKGKKNSNDDFRSLLHNHSCDCNNKNCTKMLRQYYEDKSSIYPGEKPQLLFKINNPSKSAGTQPKRQKRMQQLYDRAVKLLKVENAHDKEYIYIAIIHYSPIVIEHYKNNGSSKKEKLFTDYLLPSTLVSSSKLGVKFTNLDKFDCLGTTKESTNCSDNGVCTCNRYLNAPFVTAATNEIVDTRSARGKRSQEFSDKRKVHMASAEAEVQRSRADWFQAKFDALTNEASKKGESANKSLKVKPIVYSYSYSTSQPLEYRGVAPALRVMANDSAN